MFSVTKQGRNTLHCVAFHCLLFVSVSQPPPAEAAPVKSEYPVSWIFLKLLTGFDPNFAQKPYWATLWSRLSHHSTLTDPTLASQPPLTPPRPSHSHPVLPRLAAFICCPSNLQRNAPHHQPSWLLSSLLYMLAWTFYHPAVMHWLFFFLQTRYRPNGGYQSFFEGTIVNIPLKEMFWVFLSTGLCTRAVCVEAVNRVTALIKNK